MKSPLAEWFLSLKLQTTLEEAQRSNATLLDLRAHGLEECPNFMTELSQEYRQSLKCLFLQTNLLTQYSRINCHSLENLKGLALDYNQLTDLPFDFRHMKNLTVLNVSHNKFLGSHFFHVICQLKTLKIFWANATGIREIPSEIRSLQKLRLLGLRNNRIKILPQELFSLTSLKWLTLSMNQIQLISRDIEGLKRLVHLNLQDNQIMGLPSTLVMLQKLQYLFLQRNFLVVDQELVELLLSLPKLQKAYVDKNLVNGIDEETGEIIQEIARSEFTPSVITPWSISSPSSPTDSQVRAQASGNSAGVRIQDLDEANNNLEDILNNNDISLNIDEDKSEAEENGQVEPTDLLTVYRKSSRPRVQASLERPLLDGSRNSSDEHLFSDISNKVDEIVTLPASHTLSIMDNPSTDSSRILISSFGSNDKNGNESNSRRNEGTSQTLLDRHDSSKGGALKRHPEDISSRINTETRSHRMLRTEEWIMQQPLTSHTNCQEWRVQSCEKTCSRQEVRESPREVFTVAQGLSENVSEHVDALIKEAAENASYQNDNRVTVKSSSHSTKSSLYFMSLGKDSEPVKILNVQASFQCRRSISRMISTSEVTRSNGLSSPLPQAESQISFVTSLERTMYDMLTNQIVEEVEAETNAENVLTRNAAEGYVHETADAAGEALNAEMATSLNDIFFSSQADLLDYESSYDPSNKENSTPSSAIDDQDIIARFSDLRQTEPDEGERYAPLLESDLLRLLPMVMIK